MTKEVNLGKGQIESLKGFRDFHQQATKERDDHRKKLDLKSKEWEKQISDNKSKLEIICHEKKELVLENSKVKKEILKI